MLSLKDRGEATKDPLVLEENVQLSALFSNACQATVLQRAVMRRFVALLASSFLFLSFSSAKFNCNAPSDDCRRGENCQ